MAHDPVVAETVRSRTTSSRASCSTAQEQRARAALDAYRAGGGRTDRRPNVLVILFDDVGWGDFGCYGGGVAVGAADPQHRPAGPPGHAAHLVLLRAVVHAVAGLAHDRPAAHAPRPAAPADVRPARRPRRRGDPARAAVGRRLRHPGRRQVAHGRERREPAAERRLRRLLRLPVGVGHVHRVARPQLLPRDRLQRGAHRAGSRTCRSTSASCTPPGAARPRTWRRSPSRCSRCSTTSGPTTRSTSSAAWPSPTPAERRSPGCSTTAPAAPTSTTTPTSASSARRRPSTRTRTPSSSSTTSWAGWWPSSRRPARWTTPSSSSRPTTVPRWRRGPTPPTRRSAAPRARPGRAASGCRPSSPGRA